MDSDITQHIIEIKQSQARTETKVETIEKELLGNGNPGIKQRVESLESAKNWTWGLGTGVTFILGLFETWFHFGRHGGK